MASLASHEDKRYLRPDHSPQKNSSFVSAGLLHLPPTFLDAVIPGYSILAQTLLSHFGIDLSFYISLLALFFAATTAFQVTVNPIIERIFALTTSTVIVDEYDSIFNHILDWLASQKSLQNHRILRARTGRQCDNEDDEGMALASSNSDFDMIFNFDDFATRIPARYEPHSSTGFFKHKGYIFRISRKAERVQNEWSETVRDREKFIITVIWRSTAPIKSLIEEAGELSFSKRNSSTTILRPTPKPQRGHGNEWQDVSVRPSRSMNTVVLDDEQKLRCVSDINEFLQAAKWYSNRGIPYRRGYLFHGSPGTGKTSLSFALAGVFGLAIYCLSLSEITLTEEDLIMLFTALPQRCIVLLEDIDCAGVSRPQTVGRKKTKARRKSKKQSSEESVSEVPPAKLTNAITISGLLNAIDGVATAEGRVLIMTTNYPEKLDTALTRPGRIDLRVEFKLATSKQIRELFLRMYNPDTEEANKQPARLSQVICDSRVPKRRTLPRPIDKQDQIVIARPSSQHINHGTDTPESELIEKHGILTPAPSSEVSENDDSQEQDLEELSALFAAALPDYKFSPAEIQGYLLMHKKSPLQAVQNIGAWRDEHLPKKDIKKSRETSKNSALQVAEVKDEDKTATQKKSADVKEDDSHPQGATEEKKSNKAKDIGGTSESGSSLESEDDGSSSNSD